MPSVVATAAIAAACSLASLLLGVRVLNDAPFVVTSAVPLRRAIPQTVFEGATALNEALRDGTRHVVAHGRVKGAETAVVDPVRGTVLLFDAEGWLSVLHPNGTFAARVWYTGGRILGAAFADGGGDTIVACDVGKGLVRLTLSTREVVVLTSMSDDGVPILYPDDVVVSPRTGRMYFSDATAIAPWRKANGEWATLEGSFLTMFSGRPSGRLLCYDPATRSTTVLASDLFFANGVALSPDEDFVLVVQTFALCVSRVWLAGPRRGEMDADFAVLHMAPDGMSATADGSGDYWVALPTTASLPFAVAGRLPWLRAFMGGLPSWMWPASRKIGAIARIDANGNVVQTLYDSRGSNVNFVTSVVEHDGKLYLGQLQGDSLPVMSLPTGRPAVRARKGAGGDEATKDAATEL